MRALLVIGILLLVFAGTAHAAVIEGTSGNDTLVGTAHDDTIYGYRGRDVLRGRQGNDTLRGGRGNDRLYAHDGRRDIVRCGLGKNDWAYIDWGLDFMRGCEMGIA